MKNFPFRRLAAGLMIGSCLTLVGCEGSVGKPAPPLAKISKPEMEKNSAEEPMMTVQSEPFCQTEDGQEIVIYSLSNQKGMKVELINRGGIITAVDVPDRKGQVANVTLHFSEPERYLVNGPYFGGICGRFANRIAKGKFSLNGQEFNLFVRDDGNHLHGGKEHFMKKLWKGETFQMDKYDNSTPAVGVKLSYTSPDMEEGFPGELKTVVTYTLNNDNELIIDYEARTDKPTVLNLTNHAYWNLAGAGNGTILDHDLTLHCNGYIPVDETSIPLGEIAPVAGTCMDFTKASKIGARISETVNGAGGYDHCYVVNGKPGTLRPVARVVDPASGRVMEISTTQPGVQFYTGNHLNGSPETGGAIKHGAFCLETQHYPDSPNQPDFPSTRLNPGDVYRHTTVHKFSVAK